MTDLINPSSAAEDVTEEAQARAQALLPYHVMDTPPEPAFDDLARLAAQVCVAPSAFVIFLDDTHPFVKAAVGPDQARKSAVDQGFCLFTVRRNEMLIIPDTLTDLCFRPIPAADPPVRFYAGVPIQDPEGRALGALCVVDDHARTLTPDQQENLRGLGRQVEAQLALRRAAIASHHSETLHRDSEALLRNICDSLPALIAYVDADERYQFNNRAYEEWVGLPREQITGRTLRDVLGEKFYAVVADNIASALAGTTIAYERPLTWPDGAKRDSRVTYIPQRGPEGEVEGFAVLATDETKNRQLEADRKVMADRHAALVMAQQEVAHADRDLDAVLGIVTRRAQELTAADGAVIEMAEGGDMVYRAASGTAAGHIGLRLRRETSLSGRCVAEGRLLVCEDAETDPRVDRDACRRIGVRAMVVVPLTFLGQTVGVLKVYSGTPQAFPPDALPLLEMMVSLAVAALSAVSEAEARTALSLSERRLHALITSVPVILFALDAGGVFTQSEGKGLELLGLKPGEVVGRSYLDVHAGEPALRERIEAGLQGRAEQWLSEIGDLFFETQCLPLVSAGGRSEGLIGVAFDVTERVRAERALQHSAHRQRQFLRDVLASVTEGRLLLCQSENELPAPLPTALGPIMLSMNGGLRELRRAVGEACRLADFAEERGHDLVTAVSEAGMNCVVHVGEGIGEVFLDSALGVIQARIADHGSGISLENLPHATLKKGFTTAGSLGHGMKMMLQTADRVFLLTSPLGTTVVIEQDRVAPVPAW